MAALTSESIAPRRLSLVFGKAVGRRFERVELVLTELRRVAFQAVKTGQAVMPRMRGLVLLRDGFLRSDRRDSDLLLCEGVL